MTENTLTALWVILPVTLLSVGLVCWRADQMAEAYQTSKLGVVAGFVIGGLIFGWLAAQVYVWMTGRWPDAAPTIYLGLGIGSAVLLSAAALIMRKMFAGHVVAIYIVLNLLWGLGYGWLLPLLLQ